MKTESTSLGVGPVTTHHTDAPATDVGCFISYNSADAHVTRLIKDAVGQLDRLKLDCWEYTEDANLGQRKYDSMLDSIKHASSIAVFAGPDGLGQLQESQELDWALDAETRKQAHIFVVLLPGVAPDAVPERLRNPAQIRLDDDDVDDGRLTPGGFAKLCGGIRALDHESASAWIRSRERELFLTPPRRARALLVGICEYDDDELPNLTAPGKDIDELERTLMALQLQGGIEWDVTKCPELTREDLLRELEDFYVKGVEPDDLLLFYFSGHGATNEGSSYVMSRDASPARPSTRGGVGAEILREYLRTTQAWASIVVLDCCHGDSAGPNAGVYDNLPERSAVLGASPGPTGDAGRDGLSPFTSALINVLQEQDTLTMADLKARLQSHHSSTWAQLGTLGPVESVTFGKAKQARPMEPRRSTERVHVGQTADDRDRLRLLRRLTQTLDALLAATPERSPEMEVLIRETLEVVVEELQALTSSHQDEQAPNWVELNHMDPQPLVEVFFRDPDMQGYAGLPWEFLGVPMSGNVDWLLQSRICRVIPVAATKSPVTGKMHSPLVLSAPAPEWGPGLQEVTQRESEGKKPDSFVGKSHWGVLRTRKPDLLALQCGISPSGDLAIDTGWTIGFLKAAIDPKPVRALVIETVADHRNPRAGLALRELAFSAAQATSRSVIAVCHQSGYTAKLDELTSQGETTAEPTYSFLACLMDELMSGARLEEAAYTARHRVVMSLGPEFGPAVGVPVTVRAEPRRGATVSQSSSPAVSSQPTRSGGAAPPEMHGSEFMA